MALGFAASILREKGRPATEMQSMAPQDSFQETN